jgi:hypothetical protein
VSSLRLSADGLFYWDGKQWVSALSPDGRHRWDGASWVPIASAPIYAPQPAGFVPMPVAPPPPKAARTPTSWTGPLQYSVGILSVVYALWYAALPFWANGPMTDEIRRRALRTAAANPALYPDPSQYADTVATFGTLLLAVVAFITVAIAIVVLIGTLRRWTWMYYVVMALLALTILGLPAGLATALGIVQPAPSLGGSLVVVQWVGVALGVTAIGLGAWMLVALLRRGPWATGRELAAQ